MSDINKLFLIGNGLDLAHNLKTGYRDFIHYYYNKVIDAAWDTLQNDGTHTESIFFNFDITKAKKADSFDHLLELVKLKAPYFRVKPNTILNSLLLSYSDSDRWVDIEYVFYNLLFNHVKNHKEDRKKMFEMVNNLNQQLLELRIQLQYYLANEVKFNNAIIREFQSLFNTSSECCFLNFNYTELAKLYFDDRVDRNGIYVPIHGTIDDHKSMVFGYGDDVTEEY